MSAHKYIVKSIIVCDDVRREVNGKEILIGVYNDVIVFSSFPATLPKLVFRLSISSPDRLGKFVFQVEDSNGVSLFNVEGDVPNAPDPQEEPFRILGMIAVPMAFDRPDTFTMRLSIDGERLHEIGKFLVRRPLSEEEAKRLA